MSDLGATPAYEHRTEQLPDWRTPEWVTRLSELVDKVRAEPGDWQPVGVINSLESDRAYVVFERRSP